MERVSDYLVFKYRGLAGALCFVPFILILLFSSPLILPFSFIGIVFQFLGWIFLAIYFTFRIWSMLFVGGRKDQELITEGPYSMTRNPIYFGNSCFGLAVACFFNSLTLIIATLILCYFYLTYVVAIEEKVLGNLFGNQYLAYKQKTPRFFPSFALYHSPKNISISISALRTEAQRLWVALFMPFLAQIIIHLRLSEALPHLFFFP